MNSLEKRYPVAATLAPGVRDAKLLHANVRPRWSVDGRRCWYATRGVDGINYVLVDVDARKKSRLLDAELLAQALSDALGIAVPSAGLKLDRVDLADAPGSVQFVAFGGRWLWSDVTRQLERLGEAFSDHELVSPDGRCAVFLDGPNLRLRRLDAPGYTALTEDGESDFGWGDFIDYTTSVQRRVSGVKARPHALWSPDSTRLAVLRVDRRHVKTMGMVQSAPSNGIRPVTFDYPFPMATDAVEERERVELWLLGLDGSRFRVAIDRLESFMHRAFVQGQGRWSADGLWFDVVDYDRFARSITLWRVDARDGVAIGLFHEQGNGIVRAAPTLGMAPMFHPLDDGRLIAWSQRDGWGHLYLVAPDGNTRQITIGPWQVRSLLHVDETAEHIVFAAGGVEAGVDPYFYVPYRVSFDGSDLRRLGPADCDHDFIEAAFVGNGEPERVQSVSPDGSVFVDTWSTVTTPPRTVLRDTSTGALLLELEVGDEADSWPPALPRPEPFSVAPLEDGQLTLWGLLYKPLNFDPAKHYPVIEVIYAAPQTAVVPKGWSPGHHGALAEQLASTGFVVFIIDGPGTPFRSHAFQLFSHLRMEICGNLPDHIHALHRLSAVRPWMDLERVGIVGGSAGGFATVRAMADHPDFFKVGAAMCGSHDSTGYIPYWGEQFQGPYDLDVYARQDNNRVVERIVGALLLIHGDLDDNVHPSTTLRLVDSLIRADKDFEMLIVPNTGHMLPFHAYAVRRILDFFVEKLAVGQRFMSGAG